jgi:hypothetical protein
MHLTIAQELLSEESIHMSQRSASSPNTSLDPSFPSTGVSKCKPRFAEFACPLVEVISQGFATGVLVCSSSLRAGFPVRCRGHKGSDPNGFLGTKRELSSSYEW